MRVNAYHKNKKNLYKMLSCPVSEDNTNASNVSYDIPSLMVHCYNADNYLNSSLNKDVFQSIE